MAALILAYGLLHNAPVYDYFIEGAKNGLATALEILPFLIGIYLAVNGLTASGLLQFIYHLLAPLLDFLEVPSQLLPLMLLRAVSALLVPGGGLTAALLLLTVLCGTLAGLLPAVRAARLDPIDAIRK